LFFLAVHAIFKEEQRTEIRLVSSVVKQSREFGKQYKEKQK